MRLNTFFYLSHLIFGNSNSAASSTMHGETHRGGRVVPSLMVVENGAIGFACTIFSIPVISPQRTWSKLICKWFVMYLTFVARVE